MRLGKVAGVSVGAHWSTLLVLALFATLLATTELPATAPGYPTAAYWVVAVVLAGVFLASILAHELAHAAVARHHGVPVDSITLWLLGGVAQLHEHARDPDGELRIALAGPAASLVIGVVSGVVAAAVYTTGGPGLLVGALAWLATVSVVLAVFNLLPGAPLDGGRVLTALLWRRSGDERAARQRSARIGQVLGQVLIGARHPRRPRRGRHRRAVARAPRLVPHVRGSRRGAQLELTGALGRRTGRRRHDTASRRRPAGQQHCRVRGPSGPCTPTGRRSRSSTRTAACRVW